MNSNTVDVLVKYAQNMIMLNFLSARISYNLHTNVAGKSVLILLSDREARGFVVLGLRISLLYPSS